MLRGYALLQFLDLVETADQVVFEVRFNISTDNINAMLLPTNLTLIQLVLYKTP